MQKLPKIKSTQVGLQEELTVWRGVLSLVKITSVYQTSRFLLEVVTFINQQVLKVLPLHINLAVNTPPWLKCCCYGQMIPSGFERAPTILRIQSLPASLRGWNGKFESNTDSKLRTLGLLAILLSSSRNLPQSTGKNCRGGTKRVRVFNKLRISIMLA